MENKNRRDETDNREEGLRFRLGEQVKVNCATPAGDGINMVIYATPATISGFTQSEDGDKYPIAFEHSLKEHVITKYPKLNPLVETIPLLIEQMRAGGKDSYEIDKDKLYLSFAEDGGFVFTPRPYKRICFSLENLIK